MVILSIVAVWLVLALVLGVTVGRSIHRADAAELGARSAWDAVRTSHRSPAAVPVRVSLVRRQAA